MPTGRPTRNAKGRRTPPSGRADETNRGLPLNPWGFPGLITAPLAAVALLVFASSYGFILFGDAEWYASALPALTSNQPLYDAPSSFRTRSRRQEELAWRHHGRRHRAGRHTDRHDLEGSSGRMAQTPDWVAYASAALIAVAAVARPSISLAIIAMLLSVPSLHVHYLTWLLVPALCIWIPWAIGSSTEVGRFCRVRR